MGNFLRKLIEWAFFKYVVDHSLDKSSEEALAMLEADGLEIVFEPHDDLKECLQSKNIEASFTDWATTLLTPKFDTEVEQAMYEKRFFTLH